MACTDEYIDFISTTLTPLGEVRVRKMMSDYVVYLDDKCVITACDNCAYVKKLPGIAPLMADAETGSPYPGARECYILNFENQRHARMVIKTLYDHLPYPKTRKK